MKIKYDFVKADSLTDELGQYISQLDAVARKLKSEIAGTSKWWDDSTHDSFVAEYERVRPALDCLSNYISDVRKYVGNVTNEKKTLEKNGKRHF